MRKVLLSKSVMFILMVFGCYVNGANSKPVPDGFVLVEGGTFTMGSTDSLDDASPTHSVTLSSYVIILVDRSNAGTVESGDGQEPERFPESGR